MSVSTSRSPTRTQLLSNTVVPQVLNKPKETCRMVGLCWFACLRVFKSRVKLAQVFSCIFQWTKGPPHPHLSLPITLPSHTLTIYEAVIYTSQRSHDQPQGASLGKASLLLNLKLFSLCSLIPLPPPLFFFCELSRRE